MIKIDDKDRELEIDDKDKELEKEIEINDRNK